MLARGRPQRAGSISPWWAVACFAIFALLLVYRLAVRPSTKTTIGPTLLEELADATILEDADEESAREDWPQWRGPHRDGVYRTPDLAPDWPEEGPPILWRTPVGPGLSSLAVVGSQVFSMMQAGDNEVVVCWKADDGQEQWRFPYPAHFKEPVGLPVTPGGGGPRATPTVDGERLYTLGATGWLRCLRTADGKSVWEHSWPAEYQVRPPEFGYAAAPLVEGELLFAGAGATNHHSIVAYGKRTGDRAWGVLDDPAGYIPPVATVAAGVRQLLFVTGQDVLSLSPTDGRLYWRYTWPTAFGIRAATPLTFRAHGPKRTLDYLFLSSGLDRGSVLLKLVSGPGGGVDVQTVYERLRADVDFTDCVRSGDHIYGIEDPGTLTCLEIKTGKVAWRQRGFGTGTLLLADGRLLVLKEEGELVLAAANPDGYKRLAGFKGLGGHCWAPPALAHGKLYVRTDKEIVCLDLRQK